MVLHRSEKMKGLRLFLFSLQLLGMDLSQIMLEGIFLTPIYRAVIGVIVFVVRGGYGHDTLKCVLVKTKEYPLKSILSGVYFQDAPTNQQMRHWFYVFCLFQSHSVTEYMKF